MIREKGVDVVVVWTTFPGDGDPAPLAQTLVSECLAACVTTQAGLRSVYRWQDAVEEAVEYQLVIKTTADRVERLEQRVSELHSLRRSRVSGHGRERWVGGIHRLGRIRHTSWRHICVKQMGQGPSDESQDEEAADQESKEEPGGDVEVVFQGSTNPWTEQPQYGRNQKETTGAAE